MTTHRPRGRVRPEPERGRVRLDAGLGVATARSTSRSPMAVLRSAGANATTLPSSASRRAPPRRLRPGRPAPRGRSRTRPDRTRRGRCHRFCPAVDPKEGLRRLLVDRRPEVPPRLVEHPVEHVGGCARLDGVVVDDGVIGEVVVESERGTADTPPTSRTRRVRSSSPFSVRSSRT